MWRKTISKSRVPSNTVNVPVRAPRTTPVSVIVVAVSTGGPNALAQIVPELPADLPVPVLVVQHMPAIFTESLARRLDRLAALSVVEASEGDEVTAGRVYIAPGGRHLEVTRRGPATAPTAAEIDDFLAEQG